MFQTNPYFGHDGGGTNTDLALVERISGDVVPLIVALAIAAFFILHYLTTRGSGRRRPGRGNTTAPARRTPIDFRQYFAATNDGGAAQGATGPARQLEAIATVNFRTRPLLNRSEARLLPALERATRQFGRGHRLMAQTCLGEVLSTFGEGISDERLDAAYFAINAKRLDFAVFNGGGHIVAAIEYQGSGHYHANSFIRDAVKREALRKAGVRMLELSENVTPDEAAAQLTAVLESSLTRI